MIALVVVGISVMTVAVAGGLAAFWRMNAKLRAALAAQSGDALTVISALGVTLRANELHLPNGRFVADAEAARAYTRLITEGRRWHPDAVSTLRRLQVPDDGLPRGTGPERGGVGGHDDDP